MIVESVVTASPAGTLAVLVEGTKRFAAAAARGNAALLYAEAERYLALAANADQALVLQRAGGVWRAWDHIDDAQPEDTSGVPAEALGWEGMRQIPGGWFVAVRVGALCVLLRGGSGSAEERAAVGVLAAALDLALSTCDRQRIATENLEEIQVLQRVATRILKSHEVEEILLLITQEAKRLLAADICGIMLREGEEIVMQRCVGNFSVDTASLRMRQGQGLAGRVFATREPCRVEDYLESSAISRDFHGLAQTERVRSALGAPLLSKDEVIGVLEVWRRRLSTFTEQDSSRLVALANLASIAIENARLYGLQASTMRDLAAAHQGLGDRYRLLRELARFQEDLVQLLLDGRNLGAIAARAAQHLDAAVLITDTQYRVLGASPPVDDVPERLRAALKDVLREAPGLGGKPARLGAELCAQPIVIGGERVGLVAVLGKRNADDATELAVSQVAMAAALFHVEQRAASKARSETLEAVLWDLLEGSDAVRRAALDRAREMRVDLDGGLRVYLCSGEGLEKIALSEGWGASEVRARRRVVRGICERPQGVLGAPRLLGMRGNLAALVCSDTGIESAERTGQRLALEIAREIVGLSVHVGVSGARNDALMLSSAYREAMVALEVARQRGASGSAVFDRVGVVGMLLSLRQEADMQRLVQSTFGPLLDKGTRQREVLLRTLRVFFDVNCSQQAAAKRLRVHHKTVSYRLSRITDLTGLDLGCHDDRLLADLALYINELMAAQAPGAQRGRRQPRNSPAGRD